MVRRIVENQFTNEFSVAPFAVDADERLCISLSFKIQASQEAFRAYYSAMIGHNTVHEDHRKRRQLHVARYASYIPAPDSARQSNSPDGRPEKHL